VSIFEAQLLDANCIKRRSWKCLKLAEFERKTSQKLAQSGPNGSRFLVHSDFQSKSGQGESGRLKLGEKARKMWRKVRKKWRKVAQFGQFMRSQLGVSLALVGNWRNLSESRVQIGILASIFASKWLVLRQK